MHRKEAIAWVDIKGYQTLMASAVLTQNVVVHWRKNLPVKRDQCWFLMTDQNGSAHPLCNLYGNA